jgi:hypothetical protein
MSFNIHLSDPSTKQVLRAKTIHYCRGGSARIGGKNWVAFSKAFGSETALRTLYGKSGAESLPILEAAITSLGEGSARRALVALQSFALACPYGVWMGD